MSHPTQSHPIPSQAKEHVSALKTAEKNEKEAARAVEKAKNVAEEAEKTVKVEANEAVEEVINNSESDDEEIHTRETDINGKTYLIDDDNNLYSCVTHEEIGQYNLESQTIIPL